MHCITFASGAQDGVSDLNVLIEKMRRNTELVFSAFLHAERLNLSSCWDASCKSDKVHVPKRVTLYSLERRLESDIFCAILSRMKENILHQFIPESLNKHRLDVALSQLFPAYSRSQHQQWIKNGCVKINDVIVQKPRHLVQSHQFIVIQATLTEQTQWTAQSIPLSIIFEDEYLVVVNKPVGLVVHPGAGNPDQTLVNALLHYAPALSLLPRAGIIHRLDKDTSGLLVIAKTLPVHHALIKQMQARDIHREYRAIVQGEIISGGTIDEPVGRHPIHRTKMAVVKNGKPAITHYRVLERFIMHTLLSIQLETGRTHQIRVHLSHHHYPIVGDHLYGKHKNSPKLSVVAQAALRAFNHQALHAYRLILMHPVTGKTHHWTADMPDDIQHLLHCLRDGV